jgi:hypothetical protein
MKRIAAACVLAVLAATWLIVSRGGGPLPATVGDAATAEQLPPISPRALDRAVSSEPRAIERTEAGLPAPTEESGKPLTALLVSILLTEDESPVGGAKVTARLGGKESSQETNEDGRCRFELQGAITLDWLEVSATATTAAVAMYESQGLPAGQVSERTLRVTRGASLAGYVVDSDGRAVPGAEVIAWCREFFDPSKPPDRVTQSAADGSFALAHLGRKFQVSASAPGMTSVRGIQGELPPGEQVGDARLVLAPAIELRGRVLGLGDAPVEHADVSLSTGMHADNGEVSVHGGVHALQPVVGRALSNASGKFVLGPIPRRVWPARVSAKGYLGWQGSLDPDLLEHVIRLDPGAELAGRVLGFDGRPVEGAKVRCRSGSSGGDRTTTGADGIFHLRGLAETDAAVVQVHGAGNAILVRQPVEIRGGEANWIELRLEPPLALAGRVVDSRGGPVPRARIEIEGDRVIRFEGVIYSMKTTWEWGASLSTARADGEGRFRIDDLYDGLFRVRAISPTDPQLKVDVQARSGSEDLVLALDPATSSFVTLAGLVRDARTGEPVRDFTLTLFSPSPSGGGSGRTHGVTDPEGRFRLQGVDPGVIRLDVHAAGYAYWSEAEREYAPGDHVFDVALSPSRTLQFRIVGADGQPVGGFVSFRGLDGRAIWPESGVGGRASSLSLPEGEATAKGLPAEQIQMVVRVRDRSREWVLDVDLRRQPSGVQQFAIDYLPAKLGEWSRVICGARRGADLERFEGLAIDDALAALKAGTEIWNIDRRVEVRFFSSTGELQAAGSVEPAGAEGYDVRWSCGTMNSSGRLSQPLLRVMMPLEASRVELRAEGYEPLDLTVALREGPAPPPARLVLLTRVH